MSHRLHWKKLQRGLVQRQPVQRRPEQQGLERVSKPVGLLTRRAHLLLPF